VAEAITEGAVTSPPTVTPAAQSGSGNSGTLNSTVPGSGVPNSTWATVRIAITTRPSLRKTMKARAHGALLRRALTT